MKAAAQSLAYTAGRAALAFAGTISIAFGSQRPLPAQQPERAPVFKPAPCPADTRVPAGMDPSALRCGSVTVPQKREEPSAKLAPIVLPVVIYEPPSAQRRSPLVFLAGGPGESAIDVVADIFLATPVGQLAARERPIIAFNQRGFGGTASGTMPDLGQLGYSWRATREESIQALVDSARLVRERLRARGVLPQYFTTLRAVDDVYDVVHALGYERVVLFGGSYGTRVALQVMHRYPGMVEATILDGVAPPPATELFDPEQLAVRRRAVAVRVVSDCVRDPACASEYRELKSLLSSLERPEAPPLHLVISLPPGGSWYNVNLNGRDVLSALGAYAGSEVTRAALPQILEELARGDTVRRPLSPQIVLQVVHEVALSKTAGPIYPLVYHVVLCGDIPAGVLQAGGRAVCEALGVPFSGAEAIAPVTSDIPTLLLSSAYDSQTPPEMAEQAAKTLPNSFRVLFPGVGHLAYARTVSASCVAVIAQAFLIDPAHAPPDRCATSLAPSFLPRSTDVFLAPR